MKSEVAGEKPGNVKTSWFGWKSEKKGKDIEIDKPAPRPTRLFAPVYNGIGAGLCLCQFNSFNLDFSSRTSSNVLRSLQTLWVMVLQCY